MQAVVVVANRRKDGVQDGGSIQSLPIADTIIRTGEKMVPDYDVMSWSAKGGAERR